MKGILLVNTGSPRSSQRKDVKAFVGAMLSDPMVMTVPDWFRPILVKGIILPLRQFSSTRHYSLIWDHKLDMSPLIYHMQQLALKLEKVTNIPVEIGMRYEVPDITSALNALKEKCNNLTEVIVVPLFPHYAESSYNTTVKEVERCYQGGNYAFGLHFIEPYFSNPDYIKALADSIKPMLTEDFDKLIFNYHSLPISHVEKAWKKDKEFDYVFQTKETTKLVVAQLGINPNKVRQVYSSAIGKNWLHPSLNETAKVLAKDGDKRLVVVSPGFSVDNLETLFDIGIEAKEKFLEYGGKQLDIVPCLNSDDMWVEAIEKMTS